MFGFFFFLSWWLVGVFWEDRFCKGDRKGEGEGDTKECVR
jgi:hypothetical protein